MSKYKPFLVIYYPFQIDSHSKVVMAKEGKRIEDETGYHVLFLAVASNFRAEIISVDKATVVEDIQKYIDLKLIENENTNKEVTRG